MAKLIDITMLGDKELQRAINEMEHRTGKRIVREALKSTAREAERLARETAPVSAGGKQDGMHLRDTIKVANSQNNRKGQFGAAVVTGTRAELGIDPDDDYYYPIIQEYGANYHLSAKNVQKARRAARRRKMRRISEGKGINFRVIPPRPYLRPAFDKIAPEAAKKIIANIWERVRKAWARAERKAARLGV